MAAARENTKNTKSQQNVQAHWKASATADRNADCKKWHLLFAVAAQPYIDQASVVDSFADAVLVA